MDSALKVAVILSAYDKMSSIVNKAVGNAHTKFKGLKKAQESFSEFGEKSMIAGLAGTAFFGESIHKAEEAEIAANRLKQVFKSMGEANNEAAEASEKYADKLQLQIGYDKEAIMAVQAKVATFKSVSSETARMSGMFDRATKAAFDMQSTGFGEASQNAVQLGKALEDPIKGIMSLRKSGITFTDTERERIAIMVEAGKKAKAQEMIMKAVEKQVGNVSEATMTAGKRAKIMAGETMESIGKIVLPIWNSFLTKISSDFLPKLQKFVEEHPKLVKFAGIAAVALLGLGVACKAVAFGISGITGAIEGIKVAGNILSSIGSFFMANPIMLAVVAIAGAAFLIYKYWTPIKAFFSRLWEGIKAIFTPIVSFVWNFIKLFTPIGWIIKLWTPITKFFSAIWDMVKAIFTFAFRFIKFLILNFTPLGFIIKNWNVIGPYFKRFWDFIKGIFTGAWNYIKNIFGNIVKFVFGLGKSLFDAGANIINSIIEGIKSKIEKVTGVIKNVAKKIRDFFPFSPAKEGPLRDIHKIKLVETIAQSINPNAMLNAMHKTTGAVFNMVAKPGGFTPNVANAANPGNTSITINVDVKGSGNKDDAAKIADVIGKKFEDLMKKYNSQKARVSFS